MLNDLMKKYPTAAPIGFLTLVVVVPFWKLATMQGYIITDDIFTSDIMNIGLPFRHFIGEALRSGQLPVWMPHIYGGYPLLAGAGVCYPLNLILFGLLPSSIALNLSILLILVIAAVSMYMYAREIEAGIAGALVAAVSFAYSGFMIAHLKHDSLVGTVCWFPLGLYLIERALKGPGRGRQVVDLLFLGIVFGMQSLSGHIQTAYYSGLFYGIYFLFRMLWLGKRERAMQLKRHPRGTAPLPLVKRTDTRLMIWFVAAMVLGICLSAVQLIPTYEMTSLSYRSGGVTFDFAANYAYDPANVKTFFYPYANGDIGNGTYRGNSIFWEDYGYVGLVVLLLAFYGAAKRWRTWQVKFFGSSALLAYVLVLGPNTPVYELVFHVVPGMKFFRFPTRFLFVVDASLGVLAATGLDQLVASFAGRRKSESGTVVVGKMEWIVIGLVIADLVFFQMRQNPIVNANVWSTPPQTARIVLNDKDLFRIYSPGATEAHKAAFSAARGWEGDLQPYIDQREFLQVSSNVLYGVSSVDGYAPLTPHYVVDVWGDHNRAGLILKTATLTQAGFIPTPSFLKIISLFNIKYVLSPWSIKSDQLEAMPRVGQVFMYRNPAVLPRAFVADRYRLAENQDAAKAILLSEDFDPSHEVILNGRPSVVAGSGPLEAKATIESYKATEVVLRVSSNADAFLVLSDMYYPGWKAEIDGVEVPILQANICQRAVQIAKGNHAVRFVFDSSSVKAGFCISIAALLAVGGLLVAARRNG
jgi:hypothetical protein